ncbi:PREDICTED: unnamed product [Prunus dulcis]|uniref:PREDICTED: unnamed product n=1 Tax=Prunus dulcis TaxID=3755 RepID=A0A5E4ED78_PRUDU|nr:uncharacterized protein LOC117615875 isoform X2 [Prunus dulcis]KAI5355429.1 hypothetical protein L3X38_008324 [Prunus dulcis]VVA13723.1 PREDICTED: unnamed product [Prunus dulcis]
MEKEASTKENVTSSLAAQKLDRDTLDLQKSQGGEPSKEIESLSISTGGPKLENNGEDGLVEKTDVSGDLKSKEQGKKLDSNPSHSGMGEKIDERMDLESKAQEKDSDSNKEQNDSGHKVASTAQEEKLHNDGHDNLGKKTDQGKDLESKAQEETNQTTDKILGEEEELEPVFDGTEVPGMEANRSMSTHTLDLDSETQGVVKKAVALTNLVKIKGVVVVSTFLRRLSGKRDEDEQDVIDHADKNASDSTKDSEAREVSQKTVDRSAWNPLSFIRTSQDGDAENKAEQREEVIEEPAQAIAIKGRVILYTRLGCQDCKEARLFLYRKKLRYVEINIDVFPSRKLELEKIAGSSSVPKVFFNEVLIGGLSELKGLNESGKFDEKIDYLISEPPSFEAPLPPLSGEDDLSNSGAIDELALIARKMKEFVIVKDRFYKMRRFMNCFSGSEAVDFLAEDQYLEREEAIEFGRKLASKLFFHHFLEENLFEDGNHLYRFLDDDPIVSQCHNIPRGIIDVKPKPILDIASRLRFLFYAILEAYVSEDGKHVDYRSIHGSEEFARYLRIVEELQRVEVKDMQREEKLAFFINLYNLMAIHAILVWGHPAGAIERKRLFGDFKYVVGGSTYSLSAIQNGILRGNQRPPYNLMKPFGAKDKRSMVTLPYSEPLIHFALVCGTRSGPALRCYSPGDIDKELMEAARNFLRNGGLIIDFDTKVASASKILKWFSVDFGKNEVEVLKHSSNYLEPAVSEALLESLAKSQLKVMYQPYDWGVNC